jgi:cell division protein FtsQ
MRIPSGRPIPEKPEKIVPPRRRSNRKRRDIHKAVRRICWALLLMELVFFCFANPYLRMTHVQIDGLRTLATERVFQEAKAPSRTNLLWMWVHEPFERRLTKADPVIEHVWCSIRLPHTLVLHVTERAPYVLLHAGDRYLVLDRKKTPFRALDKPEPGLPILEWSGESELAEVPLGAPIRAHWLADAYDLLDLVANKKNLTVASVEVDQNANLCLNRLDHLQIKLGQADALPQKIALAQATMDANGGELARQAAYIDVSCPERPAWMPRSAYVGKEGSDGTFSDAARQPDNATGHGAAAR